MSEYPTEDLFVDAAHSIHERLHTPLSPKNAWKFFFEEIEDAWAWDGLQ